MSVILDALRRRSADGEQHDNDSPERTASTDAVLATLGYPPRSSRGGLPRRTLIVGGVAAIAVGFLGLTLVIFLLSPSPAPPRAAAARPAGAHAPAGPVAPAPDPAPRSADQAPLAANGRQPVAPRLTESPADRTPLMAPRLPADTPPRDGPSVSGVQARAILESTSRQPGVLTPNTAQASGTSAPPPTSPSSVHEPAPPIARAESPRPAPRRARSVPVPEPEAAAEPPTSAVLAPAAAPAEDHFRLALYYQRIGDYETALAHYRPLLEQQDDSAEVHNNLGLLYQDRGNGDDAVKQFQRAIALDPSYVKAHNNLGVALIRANRGEAAAAELRIALAEDPRNVESLVNLALVQRAAGRTADARDLLRRALQIDPRSAGSHYNLAVVADESGDQTMAVEHYRAFLRYGAVTHAELVSQVRARLTALGAG